MSNNVHGLTVKDESGRTIAHPLYWVWQEKRKHYEMVPKWTDVAVFVEWAEKMGWERGNSIRRFYVEAPYGPTNCYVHVRGTPLRVVKGQ